MEDEAFCRSWVEDKKAVKERRKLLEITQADLAFKSGVGLRFVRDLEQGKKTLRMAGRDEGVRRGRVGFDGADFDGWDDHWGMVFRGMRRFPWWGAGKDKKEKRKAVHLPVDGFFFLQARD